MRGLFQSGDPNLQTKDEFKTLLKTKWILPVACQNVCPSNCPCICQREIVDVLALEAWWKKQASAETNHTKLRRFLDDMDPPPHRNFPIGVSQILKAEESYLRVLSLLIEQGRDHLIDRFCFANVKDQHLEYSGTDENLREKLAEIDMTKKEAETVIREFRRDKWAYCPLSLHLDMERNLQGTNVIVPFCRKLKLGDKGGTASLYFVAVRKDLILDSALATVLKDTLYDDPDHGQCFRMVLKSYCGNKKSDFELEKAAFSGLQTGDRVPIVRYLGSYTHDFGEGEGLGKTYNLLLEPADCDLYQAWADVTNIPPVQAHEILRSWQDLFEIARAIHHVHDLEIQRGKNQPLRFNGWHADIKPDNILSIRGRLKLADFGFSSFMRVEGKRDDRAPTELIRGFTDTYGAPEVFHMQRPDGTLSRVPQSIDTWSFGCVLSVAATWIVLGFQGVREYEQFRRLSPANNRTPMAYDRFHDGDEVLPEVRHWHNYLRGHLRCSDTTTELVLELIENHLLKESSFRPELKDLCAQLDDLSAKAKQGISKLRKHSRQTDVTVRKALEEIERRASIEMPSEQTVNPLPTRPFQRTGPPSFSPEQWVSMQLQKSKIIDSIPLGRTVHRMEILKEETESSRVFRQGEENPEEGAHNGAFTDSPIDDRRLNRAHFPEGAKTPWHSQPHESRSNRPDKHQDVQADPQTPKRPNLPDTPPTSHPPIRADEFDQRDWDRTSPTTHADGLQIQMDQFTPPGPGRPFLSNPIAMESPLAGYHALGAHSNISPALSSQNLQQPRLASETSSRTVREVECPTIVPGSSPYTPSGSAAVWDAQPETSSPNAQRQTYHHYGSRSPTLSTPSPKGPGFPPKRTYDPGERVQSMYRTTVNPNPSIILSTPPGDSTLPADDRTSAPTRTDEGHPVPTEQMIEPIHSTATVVPNLQSLPPSVLDLHYDICQNRKAIDGQRRGLTENFRGLFRSESRPRDASLWDTFSEPRELIFVVDNSFTMAGHWPIVTFVAETLAIKVAGLDKSGIDLHFTVGKKQNDLSNLKGDSGRRLLKEAINSVWPDYKPRDDTKTDMAQVCENMYDEWEKNGRRATTLYVFTDANWLDTDSKKLQEAILRIAEEDTSVGGKRHFSIQFIRFGDGDKQRERLQALDDRLCVENKLRDIIDHCSWQAPVDKMIKGSIEGFHDEEDPTEPPLPYDYPGLVKLFHQYNTRKTAAAGGGLVVDALHRSPSQVSSGRSSTSTSGVQGNSPHGSKRQSKTGLFR